MKRNLACLCLWGLATVALADVEVSGGYVRGLPPGVANSSAYMTLSNTSDSPVALTGAASAVAEKVTMHSTMNHEGMMHMMPAAQLLVPAHGELVLASGGNHLMLENLKQTLIPGTEVQIILQFSDHSELTLSLPVRSVLDE